MPLYSAETMTSRQPAGVVVVVGNNPCGCGSRSFKGTCRVHVSIKHELLSRSLNKNNLPCMGHVTETMTSRQACRRGCGCGSCSFKGTCRVRVSIKHDLLSLSLNKNLPQPRLILAVGTKSNRASRPPSRGNLFGFSDR